MTPFIHTTPDSKEYYFKEGCHILEQHNLAEDEAVSIARARVEAGMQTRRHRLTGITERYLILQGEGQVEVGGLTERVGPGTVVVIPPGVDQRIRNEGRNELIFLAVCTPRFQPSAYRATE